MHFKSLVCLFELLQFVRSAQPSAPSPVAAPLRELPWGQLNFLHTTDSHGWHAGHLLEAQYSGDWGDYISFVKHLSKRADDDGSDLLVIDTGDRVEGNGLYDASNPKGLYTSDIFKQQTIDVICSGNHELYQRNTSIAEYETTVANFRNSYLASNINIRSPKDGELIPLAPRYKRFTTKNQGIRVLAFGFLFNFHGNADNTVVQNVEDTIEEEWFQDAIREKDIDLSIVTGHVPVRNSPEFDAIFKAIRGVKWDVPIVFFGGHTHIRDYKKWDKKAYGIESGRYMETYGFLSITGLSTSTTRAAPRYQRLYIDNNLHSLHAHSGRNGSTFDTELGRNVTKQIIDARKSLKLDHTFGCAPQDYWLNRAPYPSEDSLLTWLEKQVLPQSFNTSTPSIVITNTGAMRFDIFKGPFTIDSIFLVSPFVSGFRQLKGVPYKAASQLLRLLNNEGPITLEELSADGYVDLATHLPSPVSRPHDSRLQKPIRTTDKNIVPGYTTHDDAGDDGDDTIHERIQFYNVPNCIASNVGFDPAEFRLTAVPDTVDLVYNEFVESWILLGLRYLGVKYEKEDASLALDGASFTKVMSEWVQHNWPC